MRVFVSSALETLHSHTHGTKILLCTRSFYCSFTTGNEYSDALQSKPRRLFEYYSTMTGRLVCLPCCWMRSCGEGGAWCAPGHVAVALAVDISCSATFSRVLSVDAVYELPDRVERLGCTHDRRSYATSHIGEACWLGCGRVDATLGVYKDFSSGSLSMVHSRLPTRASHGWTRRPILIVYLFVL
jgi:hypothetical protein